MQLTKEGSADAVLLCEVGPRDGFQFEPTPIPTDEKVEVLGALAHAGLRRIQATSFVHPARVPQMADAEEVCRRLPDASGVTFSGLVLNRRGLDRALTTALPQIDVSAATNPQHAQDNTGMALEAAWDEAERTVRDAVAAGRSVQMGLQTVFGYTAPGDTPLARILALAERFAALGIESLSLADTTGLAQPRLIERVVREVMRVAPDVPLVLHLHDTRGLGLVNVHAALACGIRRFDTSMAGMGGCPFIPGAAGNIPTEDTAYLLHTLGYATGVDVDAVGACSRRIEALLNKRFPGRLHHLPERAC